uniref:Reverse transcriptase domain-containing protein n=1 Tax=Haemonchus contortus TaxID=6289 RepID=A0A7I4XU24_HAECO
MDKIDHIIFNRRFCLTDVAIVPEFYTGSDHRLLRAKFCFVERGQQKNCSAPGPEDETITSEESSQVIVRTLAGLFGMQSAHVMEDCWCIKKGEPDDIGNHRPNCLLSVIYKLFTHVILNRICRILDEGQPCEQAGFRRGFSLIVHIHTLIRLIEVSREYKMSVCLKFIDLKEAFDAVETEAVIEALGNQGVPTQ